MAKNKTTERAREAKDIDFRELEDIAARAKSGDKVAQKELDNISKTIKDSGFSSIFSESISESISPLVRDIVQAYISAYNSLKETDFETIEEVYENIIKDFNEEHETDFVSLDEIKDFAKRNKIDEPGGYLSLVSRNGIEESGVNLGDFLEIMTTRPKEYKHIVGALTDKIFSNKLTKKPGEADGSYRVTLFKDKKTNQKIQVYASISYDKVLEELGENVKIPELTEDDRQVLDGIVSNILAGNLIMTDRMIYRGFSGKEEKGNALPDGVYQMIETALDHFRGLLSLDDSPRIEALGDATTIRTVAKEPLLSFRQITTSISINGKMLDGSKTLIIEILGKPLLLKYAENYNEIDTQDIKLLDVPKISNNIENLRMKRYLHKQIIARRHNFETCVLKNHIDMTLSRKIRFSAVFSYMGLSKEEINDKSSKGRNEKARRIKRIYKILDHYQNYGFYKDYTKTHKKGTNEVDGVELNFIGEKKKPQEETFEESVEETTEES